MGRRIGVGCLADLDVFVSKNWTKIKSWAVREVPFDWEEAFSRVLMAAVATIQERDIEKPFAFFRGALRYIGSDMRKQVHWVPIEDADLSLSIGRHSPVENALELRWFLSTLQPQLIEYGKSGLSMTKFVAERCGGHAGAYDRFKRDRQHADARFDEFLAA